MADHVGHWTAMSDNGKVPIADLVENYGGANDGFVSVPNSVCHLSTGLNNPVSPFARNCPKWPLGNRIWWRSCP